MAAPANLMGISLMLAASGRLLKWWRFSDLFFWLGVGLFVAFGVVPTGPSLLAWLETQHSRPRELPGDVAGIIVLGGAFDTYLSNIYGWPILNDGVERVLDGAMLARYYKDATLLFSGGSGRLVHRERTEAEDAQVFFSSYPDLKERIRYENRSRNTWQNAAFSRDMAQPRAGERWILVTSAYHMPRAAMMFKAAGWPEIITWPTDYRTNGKIDLMPHKLDVLGNLYHSHLAVRELIGHAVYKARAKMNI
ncbi:MAG: YdcF family protein [Micavibrio aeruginosavorus]|uniref:YdcF family protein n=1 Tax=Micavibrio aeruginosavorus TaxID=349221 RepID=A0A7T5R0W7_9BACT|nr:MAG: YdcF family protein [Micavibrio aeruginosavorus]